jgi:hypothetical protein
MDTFPIQTNANLVSLGRDTCTPCSSYILGGLGLSFDTEFQCQATCDCVCQSVVPILWSRTETTTPDWASLAQRPQSPTHSCLSESTYAALAREKPCVNGLPPALSSILQSQTLVNALGLSTTLRRQLGSNGCSCT